MAIKVWNRRPRLKIRFRWPSKNHERWYGCPLCGGGFWTGASDAVGCSTELQGFGMMHPESNTVVGQDGIRRCIWHNDFIFKRKALDEAKVNIDESDRGNEIDFTP